MCVEGEGEWEYFDRYRDTGSHKKAGETCQVSGKSSYNRRGPRLRVDEKWFSCATELKRTGEEESRKLDIIPAKFQFIHHIRPDTPVLPARGAKVLIIAKGIPTEG